jgi:hypothetical protein
MIFHRFGGEGVRVMPDDAKRQDRDAKKEQDQLGLESHGRNIPKSFMT